MSKLDNDSEAVFYGTVALGVLLLIYLFIMMIVGFANAQSQMNWCNYKHGSIYYDSKNKEEGPTGRRWSPNILTLGFTGECIDPGDKGL